MYGAFGVPIALLLWINFTSKLLLYSSAWTATPSERQDREAADDDAPAGPDGPAGSREPAGPRDRRDPEAPKNAKEAPEPRAVSGDGASGPAAASGG